MDQTYDALVLGGGAAGLSAALTLSRARRRVAVVHDGTPRNRPAAHMHAYLGSDGLPPAELLARGRAEVAGYGATLVEGTVADVRRDGDAFRAALADGTVLRAGRVVVATGLADGLPDVPGLADRWGRDVLHCPFCHGWEVRGAAVGIIAAGPLAVHQATLWRGWTDDVTLFLHTADEPDEAGWEQLAALGVRVVDGRVGGLVVAGDTLTGVRLASGAVLPVAAVVTATGMHARLDGLDGLGLTVEPVVREGYVIGTRVAAGPDGATGVPGVWAAGNVTDLMAQVQVAAAGGLTAGAAVVADLTAADARAAVARYRAERAAPFSAAAERAVAERVAGPGRHGL
ncbi:thioredoxin reductase [Cellulomonas hominis]|uniref:Thioredoxin reductase n=1 Tax=Cellulomonas hominis TaxID=156981 RepID=A0A511FCD7_9CELL|nr:NAD(P)/FAD-dependent oxidoreductase [Cellulomonas hominis]MBB5471825.1 thioredoxin reductase [Cellulomonas hominis]GEL46911.1 thioredoxin reductase [Cellulomonas hominis]